MTDSNLLTKSVKVQSKSFTGLKRKEKYCQLRIQ